MTKNEIIQWIKTSNHIFTDYNEYDSNSNHYARDIFERDGELWAVEYINGEIIPAIKIFSDGDIVKEIDYWPRKVVETKNGNIICYEYILEGSSNDYGIYI